VTDLSELAAAARILGARIVVVDRDSAAPVAVIDDDGTMATDAEG
jgi:hypothetical protein